MFKIPNRNKYMKITSNGFIVLYDDFEKKSSMSVATIMTNDLIFVQSIYYFSDTDMNILYNNNNNLLSVNINPNDFKTLEIRCVKDLSDYNYVKKDNYIYKVPNNSLIMLKNLSDLSFAILSDHVIKTYLINDCVQLIMPFLLDMIRLDYDLYIY